MDFQEIISRFDDNSRNFKQCLTGIPAIQLCWKPAPEKWSIHQVVYHLADEERNDFKLRIDYLFHKPGEPWVPYDPLKNISQFNQELAGFDVTLNSFLDERSKSITWLNNLNIQEWTKVYHHPTIGPLRAGDLLHAWLAHDYMHLRQITNLQIAYLESLSSPFHIKYASP